MNEDNWIPTRQSLLSRLKDWGDNDGWKEFFDTYWRLIYKAAIRAGLTDAEAQDVVQETVISVMKAMPGYEYDRKRGFARWLLKVTKWRITDQLRKRQKLIDHYHDVSLPDSENPEPLADPKEPELDAMWAEEWEQNLIDAAVDRVKRKIDPKQYQIFDLYVLKKWPVSKVSRTMNISPGSVYLIKHRTGKLIKKEVEYLQSKNEAGMLV